MLQRVHPGIAVSVKTRQAIRTVLNHSRDAIRELQGAGLIDESEAHKLEKVLEFHKKILITKTFRKNLLGSKHKPNN